MTTYYLACDLGATSGRLMLGTLKNGKLALEELHRFDNGPVKAGSSLHWDMEALFKELETGLKKAAARKLPISSISTDSWGVDYILYDGKDQIILPTFCYRDSRTTKGVKNAKAKVTWKTIYGETGIQFMALNTIYQLAAESRARLTQARKLLLIGDAFNYYCSGVARHEESLASTSQLYNPVTKTWSKKLLSKLGLPEPLFTPVVSSGSKLGPMKKELANAVGLPQIDVIATCSHDTGAAVAAVPGKGNNWAYLSSGTWSLIGVELPGPVITDQSRELSFTNEVGFGGSIRFLKNIVGMWIVEECRREWAKEGKNYDYKTLDRWTAEAAPFVSLINPNDPRFVSPDDMPAKIAAFCTETGQPVPATPGAMLLCVYESLALLYAIMRTRVEQLTGRKIKQLHIVGAIGNIVVQAIALGHLKSLAQAREVVRRSSDLATFKPKETKKWQEAGQRFSKLVA
ncbi:MAG: rhamnulokinase [Verrucomicrobia bacterium]|nr:rhamnulokinase [Verrucomicrobiota bacterium]